MTMDNPPYRRFYRAVLAVCLLLAPLMLATWFSLCPQYGNPQCPTSADPLAAVNAFRTANPALIRVFLTLGITIPYLYPLSYIGLGILAMKRSWKLTTTGIILGWFGSVPWGVIGVAMFIYDDLAHLSNDTAALALLTRLYAHWQIFYLVAGGWVIGHQLAYLFLGVALWRANTIPKWAAGLFVFSGPLIISSPAAHLGMAWARQRAMPRKTYAS